MSCIDREYFNEIVKAEGFALSEKMLDSFCLYADRLVEFNEKVNLTAITDEKGIAEKHFLDSLLLLKAVEIKQGASFLDVGAGAGFPSLPCKLMRPDLKITMLDGLNKRINFLKDLTAELSVESVCIHGRAEEEANRKAGSGFLYRESFDIVTARAVARLSELAEYCLPFVKVSGYFLAMKGSDIKAELDEAKKAISTLGGEIVEMKEFILPDGSKRGIAVIKKISQTPTKYPRNTGKMKKQPL